MISFLCYNVRFPTSKLCFRLFNTAMKNTSTRLSPGDPSSYSRPDQALVTRMHLNLSSDFDKKVLTGSVTLGVKRANSEVKQLKLDCSELHITEVKEGPDRICDS